MLFFFSCAYVKKVASHCGSASQTKGAANYGPCMIGAFIKNRSRTFWYVIAGLISGLSVGHLIGGIGVVMLCIAFGIPTAIVFHRWRNRWIPRGQKNRPANERGRQVRRAYPRHDSGSTSSRKANLRAEGGTPRGRRANSSLKGAVF
jgi:hypothetical protein